MTEIYEEARVLRGNLVGDMGFCFRCEGGGGGREGGKIFGEEGGGWGTGQEDDRVVGQFERGNMLSERKLA